MKNYEQRRATEHPGDAAAYARDGHIDMLEGINAELLEALEGMVEPQEPCRYDHNDFCQSHYCGRPCSVETARAAIAKAKGLPNG
jgi:hypothetical protein